MLNELALFTGAGGGLLASKLLGWQTICYVEWNSYAVDVLKARIRDGYIDDAPIWDDCFSFDGTPWFGLVDVITAGFPCQPFSSAGKGLSENDPRNGWPAVKRIIGEVRPSFAFLENVPGLISKPYIRRIFGDLAEIGYDAEWDTLSAASVGAPHLRERLWIIAYPNSARNGQQYGHAENGNHSNQEILDVSNSQSSKGNISISAREQEEKLHIGGNGALEYVADANQVRRKGQSGKGARKREAKDKPSTRSCTWWQSEPRVGRVAHGVAHRMERIETIGNGQVPEVARTAWEILKARITQRVADVESARR